MRDQILDGALAPGQLLRDTALAEEFGVARPTVRAAIQLLVAAGLVVRERGRSARVPVVSTGDAADLYTARAAIGSSCRLIGDSGAESAQHRHHSHHHGHRRRHQRSDEEGKPTVGFCAAGSRGRWWADGWSRVLGALVRVSVRDELPILAHRRSQARANCPGGDRDGSLLVLRPLAGSRLTVIQLVTMQATLGSTTVAEAVAAALRDQLLDGALAPGQVLRDTALAEEFGVARPTIRAAIQLLVAAGLVVRERGRSARVPAVSAGDVADLYTARAAVELAAIDLIERRSAPLDPVQASFNRLRALRASTRWRDVVDADVEFHQSIVSAAASPRLLALFEVLANETRLVIALQRGLYESVDDLVDEHRRLLAALRSQQFDSCRLLLRDHFNHAVRLLSPALAQRKDIS